MLLAQGLGRFSILSTCFLFEKIIFKVEFDC